MKEKIYGQWNQMMGLIKEQWGKLTDDDLVQINGKREQLIGKLQKIYGYSYETAKKELSRWESKLNLKPEGETRKEYKLHQPCALFGIVNGDQDVQRVVEHLNEEGFLSQYISIVHKDIKEGLVIPDGAVAGAATGGLIGGSLGFLSGLGAMTLPGIGVIFVGGPLL